MQCQASREYDRIRHLSAFNVTEAKPRKVNQYLREYTFRDGSILRLYCKGHASAATGPGEYKTIVVGLIRANAFGA